jgi:ethanolamine utilization microcompartment shell protein EutS
MGMFKDKTSAIRHFNLAAGVGALLASGVVLYRGQIAFGFLIAFFGLSAIVMAESDIDVTKKHTLKSFGILVKGRSSVSTLGKLCEIASYFCLAAALISWLVLR